MVLGLVLFLIASAVILYGLQLAGILVYTIDPASMLVVHIATLALVWSSFSIKDIGSAFGFLLSRKTEIPLKKAAKLSSLFDATGDYGLYTGLLGAYIGFVLILSTVEDPSYLFGKFAVCSITYLYGFSLYALALLANRKLALCAKTDSDYTIKPRRAVLPMCLGTVLFLSAIILGIQAGGSVLEFVDLPALVLILGGSILGLLFLVPFSDLVDLIKLLLNLDVVSEDNAARSLGIFAQYNDLVVSLMVFGAGAGAIRLLPALDNPAEIGPPMAFSMMSVFYGTLLLSISRAKECILHRRLANYGLRIENAPRFAATWVAGVSLVIYLLMMAVIFYIAAPE